MAVLPLLACPESYVAAEWELSRDGPARSYWLGLFRTHIRTIADLIRREAGPAVESRLHECLADYHAGLEVLDRRPDAWGELTVPKLALYRQEVLARHGFPDPFAGVKERENARAISLYPRVVRELDAAAPRARIELLARGIFAGNEFDLGCQATTARYHANGHDFAEARDRVSSRPWPRDDLDAWSTALSGRCPPFRRVLFFVDNAGSDAILGCLPLARELADRGSEVVLAANSAPALNDITIDELNDVLERLRPVDGVLDRLIREARLWTVASGCRSPLIDLKDISPACAEAAAGADLIVLEGMGRSVETNWTARFRCPCLRAALIKDPFVADRLGVPIFSPVWRFPE